MYRTLLMAEGHSVGSRKRTTPFLSLTYVSVLLMAVFLASKMVSHTMI